MADHNHKDKNHQQAYICQSDKLIKAGLAALHPRLNTAHGCNKRLAFFTANDKIVRTHRGKKSAWAKKSDENMAFGLKTGVQLSRRGVYFFTYNASFICAVLRERKLIVSLPKWKHNVG
jgi:hypothetical protein